MATLFPTSLDTFSNPAAGDPVDASSGAAVAHHAQHANLNDAVAALEAKVGVNSSAATTSLDYLVSALTTAVAAKLAAANNLSDLASAGTARTNLGLGTSATHPATDFDSAGAASSALTTAETYTDTRIAALGTASALNSDTDGTLAANSDSRVATQKAIVTYLAANLSGGLGWLNVKTLGAKGDCISYWPTATITSGQATLAVSAGTFASADVGKTIAIPGAGAAGALLVTTISAVTNTTHITLASNAGTTVNSVKNVYYGTDDTAAIQGAVNTAGSQGAVLYWPDGIYLVAAAATTVGTSVAQIHFPSVASSLKLPGVLTMFGQSRPTSFTGSLVAGGSEPTAGVILKSTLSTAGAVLGGGYTVGNYNNYSQINVYLENLNVQCVNNPPCTGIDLRMVQGAQLTQIAVDAGDRGPPGITQPTTSTSYAIIMPPSDGGNWSVARDISVIGFFNGIGWTGDCLGDNLCIYSCQVAIDLLADLHASHIGKLFTQSGIISLQGTGGHHITIESYTTEHSSQSWAGTVYDVYDPSNLIVGNMRFQSLYPDHTLSISGGKSLRIDEVGTNRDYHNGIVGFWNLASVNDASANGNHLNNQSATFTTGQIGNGALFASASSQYMQRHFTALNKATAFTMMGWFKRTASGSQVAWTQTLGSGVATNNRVGIYLDTDGNAYFVVCNGGNSNGHVALSGTGWHHLALVFNGLQASNDTRLVAYVDGVAATLSFTGTIPNTTDYMAGPLEFGRSNLGVGGITYSNGMLNACSAWNRVLSAAEIATLYNGGTGLLLFG